MNTKTLPKLISLRTVADHLDISVRGVYRLIASGDLPRPVKIGKSTKMFEHQISDYLNKLNGTED